MTPVLYIGPPAPRAKMASPLKKKWVSLLYHVCYIIVLVNMSSKLPPPQPPGPDTPAAAPPLPVKKRQTIQRKVSAPPEEVPRPLDEPQPPGRPVPRPLDELELPGRPVPRPRTGTLKKSETADVPPRPPKASSSIPSLPPKPKQPAGRSANGENTQVLHVYCS